jgi:hypothetical protein
MHIISFFITKVTDLYILFCLAQRNIIYRTINSYQSLNRGRGSRAVAVLVKTHMMEHFGGNWSLRGFPDPVVIVCGVYSIYIHLSAFQAVMPYNTERNNHHKVTFYFYYCWQTLPSLGFCPGI